MILVGNKSDKRDGSDPPPILDLEQIVAPVMAEFKQVKHQHLLFI